jgi:hypothetical protein
LRTKINKAGPCSQNVAPKQIRNHTGGERGERCSMKTVFHMVGERREAALPKDTNINFM